MYVAYITIKRLSYSHVIGSKTTVKFLTITKHLIDSFMNLQCLCNEFIRADVQNFYSILTSVRLNKQYTPKENFLTSYTYSCIELNAHMYCSVKVKTQHETFVFVESDGQTSVRINIYIILIQFSACSIAKQFFICSTTSQ